MRLDSIDLARYGHFCGKKIEFPTRQPDYYVIYGDNEAGKSTLLRGISALLFGVPVNTPDVHSCKGSELRIGATISDNSNNASPGRFGDSCEGRICFSFRRRKGTAGTLLNLDDGQIPDGSLAPFLRELDRERFEQFFGLNHERLRAGGHELLRGKGDVGSALFQSAGLLDLRHLLDKLEADAKELFSARSRSRFISKVINEYTQARAEIRKLAISGTEVKAKQAELEAAKKAQDRLKRESHELQQELVRLRRIESNKPDLARLHDLRTDLAALENVGTLPADARRQFDEAVGGLANSNHQINSLTQDIVHREKRIQELPANSLFRAHETEIEELNAGTSAYSQSVGDRSKRLREQEDAIQRAQNAWREVWAQAVSEAENLKVVYSSKEEILTLVAEHKGLTAELRTAEDELTNVTEEQERLEQQLAHQPELADPAGLIAAVDHAKALGDTDHLTAKLKSEIDRFSKNVIREMRNLARWSGTIQELADLKTPLPATVEQYAREWGTQTEKRRELSLHQADTRETIQEKEEELGGLAAQIAGAGENELAGVRARRDELWQSIRAATVDSTTSKDVKKRSISSRGLADAFADQLRKADEIADVRFANARDVAIHDRLVKEIGSRRTEQERLEKEMERLASSERELTERWIQEWSSLGSEPLSPAEMKEWMQARHAILLQYEQAREKEKDLESLQERIASAATQITLKWAALGIVSVTGSESFPILLRMAQGFAREREQERDARDEILRQLRSLSVEKRKAKLDVCKLRLSQWSQKWSPQVQALLMPESSSPEQVAKALAVLERVFDHLKDADRLQYRVKRIGDNIELFEKKTAQVVAALDPSCSSLSPDVAVKQLHTRLLEMRDAETERKTLQEQNERDRTSVASCREKTQQASATLEKLKALAGCKNGDEQQLEAAITASERKANLQQEYKRISDGLINRNTISDLSKIEEEAAAYEVDSLRSEIEAKTAQFERTVDEIARAASRHGELTYEFERLETSEATALQAQKAEEALAQLRPAIAQYLRLRLASEVLQRAIESYREKHQGPILIRASQLFAQLTLGQHSGLTSDFGADDKLVLVAIRRSDERVHVEGLSDGTLDQLYLALRLAAIEHHVETVAPCPVIFDDLLINSDDPRASAALQVISELAKRTQVLFFTHHRRLAEMGAKAGAQMIELGSLAASAVA